MKSYIQLPIPSDSAFGRKSVTDFIPSIIISTYTKLHNVIRWIPILWKDRDWDVSFIYEILQKKLYFQRKCIVEANRHTDVPNVNRYITLCLNLIERVKNDYYEDEVFDYMKFKFTWDIVKEDPKLMKLNDELISENLDGYLKKYGSSIRYIKSHLKSKNISKYCFDINDKKGLALSVSHHNQNKARRLLFKILYEKIEHWWD